MPEVHAHFAICSQPWLCSFNLATSILLHYQLLARDSATHLFAGGVHAVRQITGRLVNEALGAQIHSVLPSRGGHRAAKRGYRDEAEGGVVR